MRKARSAARAARRRPVQRLPDWASPDGTRTEQIDGLAVEVRVVQPYQATKPYTCPGCHATVAEGVGHVVVVPLGAADERRHWHRSCWSRRTQRPPR